MVAKGGGKGTPSVAVSKCQYFSAAVGLFELAQSSAAGKSCTPGRPWGQC